MGKVRSSFCLRFFDALLTNRLLGVTVSAVGTVQCKYPLLSISELYEGLMASSRTTSGSILLTISRSTIQT
jgi:hypothetical protein